MARSTRPRWSENALRALPVVVLVAVGWRFRWTFDDGFIYFRTVDQILAGNGPVFNAGERVETFTSPAWMALLTVGDLVSPLRLEYNAALLSIAGAAGGLALAMVGSARLQVTERGGTVVVPAGAVVFVALWPVWVWTTGGLEVGITFLWLGACVAVLGGWTRRRPGALPAAQVVILGAGWLVRPELVVTSLIFVGLLIATGPGRPVRQHVRLVATAFALPAMYQVFRMGYYGMLVSTPAVAKEGTLTRPRYGFRYLWNFLGPYGLVLPLVVVATTIYAPAAVRVFGRGARSRPLDQAAAVTVTIAAAGLVHAATIVVIGGDYVHARLLLPGLFAFLAPAFTVQTTPRHLVALSTLVPWAVAAAIWLRPPSSDGYPEFIAAHDWHELLVEETYFGVLSDGQSWNEGPGLYLGGPWYPGVSRAALSPPGLDGVAVTSFALGARGYALGPDVYMVDLHGLADPLTAHQLLERRGRPGHEKTATTPWLIASLAPNPLDVDRAQNLVVPSLNPPPTLDLYDDVAWAAATLDCEPLAHLRDAVDEPMSVSRFFDNLWGASRNTALRIPIDPETAYAALCGPGVPELVQDFRSRVTHVDRLPAVAPAGTLAVGSPCSSLWVTDGTGRWRPLELPSPSVRVELTTGVATVTPMPLFAIGGSEGSGTRIAIDTDGAGRARIRTERASLAPSLSSWMAVGDDGAVQVAVEPDFDERAWSVVAEGVEITRVAMNTTDPNGRPIVLMPVPWRTPIAPAAEAIRYSESALSHDCPGFIRTGEEGR